MAEEIDDLSPEELAEFPPDLLTEEETEIVATVMPSPFDPAAFTNFHVNLADFLDDQVLAAVVSDLVERYERDKDSRREWEEREARSLERLGLSPKVAERQPTSGTYSTVTHPLIMEAAVQFQSRAIAELYPPDGTAKTVILGDKSDEIQAQADRVRDYLNYQYMFDMPGAVEEDDALLLRLPLSGSVFKKVFYDSDLGKVVSRLIPPDELVVPSSAKSLEDSPRITHRVTTTRNILMKQMASGFYRPIDLTAYTYSDIHESPVAEAEADTVGMGGDADAPNFKDPDQPIELLEMHTYYDLPGFEDVGEDGVPTGIALPYIVTIEPGAKQVLAIRRNWRPGDERKKNRNYFVHYYFIPGVDTFYGLGFHHTIGGLGRAATGALRSLLDAAAFSNLQGGFIGNGARIPGGNLNLSPGEFIPVQSSGEDLRREIVLPPFKEPSGTLFNLLGYLENAGQRFASTADAQVGASPSTGPVGTTLALIEQGSKIFSAIHKRMHRTRAKELRLVAELNGEYLDPTQPYPYQLGGEERFVMAQDFDDRIDVEPVSDPNVFSATQRISQAQALMELANSSPQMYDMEQVHRAMLQAMRIPNYEGFLQPQDETPRMDPVSENMAMQMGKSTKVQPDQDHQAHIAVHEGWMQRVDPKFQAQIEPIVLAHLAEHEAWTYRIAMERTIGQPLPAPPGYGDVPAPEIDPLVENQIAVMAAQATQLMPQPPDPAAEQAQQQQMMAESEVARKDRESEIMMGIKMQESQAKLQRDAQNTDLNTKMSVIGLSERAKNKQQEQDRKDFEADREEIRKMLELSNDIEVSKFKALAGEIRAGRKAQAETKQGGNE